MIEVERSSWLCQVYSHR